MTSGELRKALRDAIGGWPVGCEQPTEEREARKREFIELVVFIADDFGFISDKESTNG